MRNRTLLSATALVLCMAAGCGSSPASSSTASTSSEAPLGGPVPGGDICWGPHRGQMLTSGELIDQNTSSSSVILTRAWLTGARDLMVDATYAHIVHPGQATTALGSASGWPPAALRHPVAGTIVPPGGYVEILFTVTAGGPDAYAAGEDVSYTSRGQSYTQANPWRMGLGPGC
jgi:hypothetical protein